MLVNEGKKKKKEEDREESGQETNPKSHTPKRRKTKHTP